MQVIVTFFVRLRGCIMNALIQCNNIYLRTIDPESGIYKQITWINTSHREAWEPSFLCASFDTLATSASLTSVYMCVVHSFLAENDYNPTPH